MRNGRFQPIPTLAQKQSKINPSAGPHENRCEATNPVSFEYKLPKGPMQLGSPEIPGILAPQGRHMGSGCQNWQNWPSRVAGQG